MIVPFVYTLEPSNDYFHLWIFYKMLSLAKRGNGPFIAQERYFVDPDYFVGMGRNEPGAVSAGYYEHDVPTLEDMQRIDRYPIPHSLDLELIREMGSQTKAWVHLLASRWEPLEDCLRSMFLAMQKNSAQPLEAILAWAYLPSLIVVAKEFQIPVVHMEWGPLRPHAYRKTAYFDLKGLYTEAESQERYRAFLRVTTQDKVALLSREEVLSLFLEPEYMDAISLFQCAPEYEMGIACTYTIEANSFSFSNMKNNVELINTVRRHFKDSELLLRAHPNDPSGASMNQLVNDKSPTSMHFVNRCRNVVVILSNVIFEAMLWGRGAYALGATPFAFKACGDLSQSPPPEVEITFINFVAFGYLIPFELINDIEYIRWRLSSPSETDIYRRHLQHYMACRGIPSEVLLEEGEKRLEALLRAQGFDINGRALSPVGAVVQDRSTASEKHPYFRYMAETITGRGKSKKTQDQIYMELLDEVGSTNPSAVMHDLTHHYEYIALLEADCKSCSAYAATLEENKKQASSYIQALEENQKQANDYIRALEENKKQASGHILTLEEDLRKAQHYIGDIENQITLQNKHISFLEIGNRNLKVQIELLENEVCALRQHIVSMQATISWKITKPLRGMRHLISRLLHR